MKIYNLKFIVYKYCKILITNCSANFWIFKTKIFFPKDKITFISFYSDYADKNRYEKAAQKLSEKLSRWKIPHHFEKVNDQGGYRKNTLYKPFFIKNKIYELKKTVVWIDCDSNPKSPEALLKIVFNPHPFCSLSQSGNINSMQSWLLKFDFQKSSLELLTKWSVYCMLASNRNLPELDHNALKHAIIPFCGNHELIGYVKLNSKKTGFISSTQIDNTIEKIHLEATTITDLERQELLEEVERITSDANI
jgi:hypothetical protein